MSEKCIYLATVFSSLISLGYIVLYCFQLKLKCLYVNNVILPMMGKVTHFSAPEAAKRVCVAICLRLTPKFS